LNDLLVSYVCMCNKKRGVRNSLIFQLLDDDNTFYAVIYCHISIYLCRRILVLKISLSHCEDFTCLWKNISFKVNMVFFLFYLLIWKLPGHFINLESVITIRILEEVHGPRFIIKLFLSTKETYKHSSINTKVKYRMWITLILLFLWFQALNWHCLSGSTW
jgi:hypothetical protein